MRIISPIFNKQFEQIQFVCPKPTTMKTSEFNCNKEHPLLSHFDSHDFPIFDMQEINNRKLPLIAPHYCSSFVHAHGGKNSEGNQWMSVSCSTCGDLCNEIPLIKIHQGVCYLRSQIIARETRTIISFSMLRCPCLPQISNI